MTKVTMEIEELLDMLQRMGAFGEEMKTTQLMKDSREIKKKSSVRKVKRSSKAKLLDKMTKPVWDKYKKGRGKKTYVQIRAQVARSQKYKRAVKRL